MPTYLLHGFRWQRQSIRIHIVLQNLDDAAPEWITAPASSVTILNSLYSMFDFLPPSCPPPYKGEGEEKKSGDGQKGEGGKDGGMRRGDIGGGDNGEPRRHKTLTKRNKSLANLASRSTPTHANGNGNGNGDRNHKHPNLPSHSQSASVPNTHNCRTQLSPLSPTSPKTERKQRFNDWSVVKLVEQYDPTDLKTISQPFAYVGDWMVEVKLGVEITKEIQRYEAWRNEEEGGLSIDGPASPCPDGSENGNGSGSGSGDSGLKSPSLTARERRRKSRRVGWFEKLRDGLEKGGEIGWFVVVCGDEERGFGSLGSGTGVGEGFIGTQEKREGGEEHRKSPKSAGLRGFFGRRGKSHSSE